MYYVLCRYIVELASSPKDLVVDIFAGSGNFARAATSIGRHCISMDKDPILEEILKNL